MKIALVHDFLREYGGAERVVEALHEIWPEAPLYTSFVDWKALGPQAARFKNWDIRTSWAQHNWLVKTYHSPLRFLAPKIWESFDLSGYDIVLSSSGWFMCRGVIVKKPAVHICYIHHPPRNLYGYATGSDLNRYWPVRLYATIINFFLRQYDFETAQRVDYFVANSEETARRVKKFYRRDSTVIYPPVDIPTVKSKQKGGYFLSVGRLTYAKRVDLAIQACNKLKLPLKIVGKGKEEAYLRSISGPTIEFIGGVSDSELDRLYAGARAFIFSALDEDFGMVPVEAMGHGVPVIALAQGGVLETVVDGSTGLLFDEPNVSSLEAVLKKFLKMKKDWSAACMEQAKKFSKERFKTELKSFVDTHVRN
ncbi:MAG: glycosyltransferase [Candidatus Gottesmanbacteria bacterium]|nr:glycosyltransferase [Candidatus Gottesmanbacteria bacterium]